MGYVEYVLAIEELSRVDGSVGIIVASHHSLCTNHLMLGGNDAQRKRWIPRLATGEWLGAWGLTEPGSGSDAGGMRTTAARRGDGWVLNGSKTFITNGTYADCAVILALTDREKGTHGGVSAFLVEKGTPGWRDSEGTIGRTQPRPRRSACAVASVFLGDLRGWPTSRTPRRQLFRPGAGWCTW